MNALDDLLFQDLAYELDDYISSSPNPKEEYKNNVIPFFITGFKYFNDILNTQEKTILSNIEAVWNAPGPIGIHTLDEIREEVYCYKKSLPMDNVKHQYFALCLKFLTYDFISEGKLEVSLIWLYISGLLGASISRSWLYNNLIERYSQHLSDKFKEIHD